MAPPNDHLLGDPKLLWRLFTKGGGIEIFGSKHHTKHDRHRRPSSGIWLAVQHLVSKMKIMFEFQHLLWCQFSDGCLSLETKHGAYIVLKKAWVQGWGFFFIFCAVTIEGGGCTTLPEFCKVFLTTRSKVKHRVELLSSTRLWSDLVWRYIYEMRDRVKDGHTLKVWYIVIWVSP